MNEKLMRSKLKETSIFKFNNNWNAYYEVFLLIQSIFHVSPFWPSSCIFDMGISEFLELPCKNALTQCSNVGNNLRNHFFIETSIFLGHM